MGEAVQTVKVDSPRESQFRRTCAKSKEPKRSYRPITRSIRKVNPKKDSELKKFTERRVTLGSSFSFSLATLVIVVCVLAILVGPSLLKLANQYDQRNKAVAELNLAKMKNKKLREELENWQDSAFVTEQARKRLGFVEPGETRYIVLDENGKNISANNASFGKVARRPWYLLIADSVRAVGDPNNLSPGKNGLNPEKGVPAPGATDTVKEKKKR